MSRRQIFRRSHQGSQQLTDIVASLFMLELLAPSRDLYLISPWISDVPIVPNLHAEVRALVPDLGAGTLWMSAILLHLVDRGTTVRIVCRPLDSNEAFVRAVSPAVEVRRRDVVHSKGLVTDRTLLSGSMNFTYFGLNLNDETVDVTTDPADVALARLEMARYWESLA